MIVEAPHHDHLRETATAWLNLAWEIVIKEVEEFDEAASALMDVEEERGAEVARTAAEKFWAAAQYKLNNAVSLLQQSLEMFLKARIAEVSPFLLIAGEPHTWPKPDKDGNISFSNLRTLDAVNLCAAVNRVSAAPVSTQFIEFYDRLRRERNVIIHLGVMEVEEGAASVLLDILTAFKFLFPTEPWVKFRNNYLESTGQYTDEENWFGGESFLHDKLAGEIDIVLDQLDGADKKKFLNYDEKKQIFPCPKCFGLRSSYSEREWDFCQQRRGGKIECIACLSSFTLSEYLVALAECYDEETCNKITEKLKRAPSKKEEPSPSTT